MKGVARGSGALVGRTALVTGGSQGIGLQTAAALLRRGADVMLMARGSEALDAAAAVLSSAEDSPGRVAVTTGDVSSERDVALAVAAVTDAFDLPPQLLVNCAGVGYITRLLDISVAEWDSILGIHGKGAFLTTQAVARGLIQADLPGSIVNVTSLNWDTPTAGLAHYGAAKAAQVQFTRTAAVELGPYRIRVNAVAPGIVVTPMSEPYLHGEFAAGFLERTPLGRLGQPPDIADAICFLLSDDARWITGVNLSVDGGSHLLGLHDYAAALGLEPPQRGSANRAATGG